MRSYLFRSMLAAACLASVVGTSQAGALRCEPGMVDGMRAAVVAASAPRGTIYLTDEKAERFLAFLNYNLARHTDYLAQAVIVQHYPGYGFDDVSLVNNDCIRGTLRLQSRATRVAIEAAENPFPPFP
jgi:hypothetical protein